MMRHEPTIKSETYSYLQFGSLTINLIKPTPTSSFSSGKEISNQQFYQFELYELVTKEQRSQINWVWYCFLDEMNKEIKNNLSFSTLSRRSLRSPLNHIQKNQNKNPIQKSHPSFPSGYHQ